MRPGSRGGAGMEAQLRRIECFLCRCVRDLTQPVPLSPHRCSRPAADHLRAWQVVKAQKSPCPGQSQDWDPGV